MRRIESIRNIGIVAHIDAGKTSLTEAMLYVAGRIHRLGSVKAGNTTTDDDPLEIQRGITISAAATTFSWSGYDVHLIDTPGHVDFTIEVERSLRVLDGVVVVVCGVHGVEPQCETVWRQADKFGIPRIVFVNKMDRPAADLRRVTTRLAEKLSCVAAPVHLPIVVDERFEGVVDLVSCTACGRDEPGGAVVLEIPPGLREQVERGRQRLVEIVAEADDPTADRYLTGEPVGPAELAAGIRRACLAGRIVPVLCGSAVTPIGARPVLDAVTAWLPSPADLPAAQGVDPKHPNVIATRAARPDEPMAALAFKVRLDKGRREVLARVFSGKLERSSRLVNTRTGQRERVAQLLRPHAGKREPCDGAGPGDIVIIKGLRSVGTGDTIADAAAPILLEPIDARPALVSLAVEPRSSRDQDALELALQQAAEEDPTFHVRQDEESGQTIVSGVGELHLEIVLQHVRDAHGLEFRAGRPDVVYRETVAAAGEGRGAFSRTIEEQRLHAEVTCRVRPRRRDERSTFDVVLADQEATPPALVDAALSGLRDAAQTGPDGYPLQDVAVTLTGMRADGDVKNDVAARVAAAIALRQAVAAAAPIRLEPMMDVELALPPGSLGTVIGELTARRGHVHDVVEEGGLCTVHAVVPLATMFGFASRLGSLTSGRGEHRLSFRGYEPAHG